MKPAWIAVLLAALAVVVYLPVVQHGFVNYDDNVYVTEQPRVAEGFSGGNVSWALAAYVNGNWHPVTLLSHMLDVSLFGLRGGAHHATSLALHAGCVVLLFLVGWSASRMLWPAALTAALFAVHPLNVESVAWIAERKNPLSTLFWLLSMLAWIAYRRSPSRGRYAAALLAAVLAMAAKPMAVTLPFTLAILDAWPLCESPGVAGAPRMRRWMQLAPFFAAALACGLLTLAAQSASSALQTLEAYPLHVRALAVPVGYAWYLWKLVWPFDLAVFYPHPHTTGSTIVALGAAAAIAGVSVAAYVFRCRLPMLAAGWVWYLVTLAPVAGIVQVGSQAYADRYAYVPLIGIFAAVAFTIAPYFAADRWRLSGRSGLALAAACVLVAGLSVVTRRQLSYWKDSVALFEHALRIVPDSSIAWNNLGMAYVERGRVGDSVDCFRRAVQLAPWDTDARSNLGSALTVLGRQAEAVAELTAAMKQAPADASIRFNLAKALDELGRTAEAEQRLREAVAADPSYAKAYLFLGILSHRAHRLDDAVAQLTRAVALDPRDAEAHVALGSARGARGDLEGALREFESALRLDPSNARAAEAVKRLRARGVLSGS